MNVTKILFIGNATNLVMLAQSTSLTYVLDFS